MSHAVLLLSGHKQSLLVLLFKQHELHLVVLKRVVAIVRALGTGGRNGCTVLWHVHALLLLIKVVLIVHGLLVHGTRLCAAGTHLWVRRHAL